MRISILSIFLFISMQMVWAQQPNLICNGDFEDINICTEKEAACSPEAWFGLSIIKYVHGIQPLNPEFKIRLNGNSSIFIPTGVEHYRILPFAQTAAITPILIPLDSGVTYHFSMYVTPHIYAINELHVYFADSALPYLKNVQPHLTLNFKKWIKHGNKWVQLKGEYTAKGGEKYLCIGMMKPTALIKYKKIKNVLAESGYFIDNVRLTSTRSLDEKWNLDSAQNYIYNENRRHDYSKLAKGSNILFPTLLKEPMVDSTTTLPGILLYPKLIKHNSISNENNIIWQLTYIGDTIIHPNSYELLNTLLFKLNQKPNTKIKLTAHVQSGYSSVFDDDEYCAKMHARAVAKYLISKGIHANRIKIESYGSFYRINQSDYPRSNWVNNRIDYKLFDD